MAASKASLAPALSLCVLGALSWLLASCGHDRTFIGDEGDGYVISDGPNPAPEDTSSASNDESRPAGATDRAPGGAPEPGRNQGSMQSASMQGGREPTAPVTPPSDEGQTAGGDAGQQPDAAPEPPRPLVSGLSERPAAAPFLGLPARGQLTLPGWDMTDVFPALSFRHATFFLEEPVTRRLFVSEREGRIFAFENRPDVDERTLVLDISAQTLGNSDRGLVGFAFHPEFGQPGSPNRGYVYVHYPHIDREREPAAGDVITHSRLSRFTIDLATLQADPSSELVLIDQFDESPIHLGGALFFHPNDGYLYLTVGDEGLGCTASQNCGRIDKDLFSGVLRIDVDPTEDGDSHAIRRQPEAGVTANYTIPNDNPFVGRVDALEEFYALGLRSPHRMTYDAVDDMIWLGDVGNSLREELDVVTAGANFQWHQVEGFLRRLPATPEVVGTWTDPVIDFTRADARSIIGGYVYRGQRFPELAGKYVFGDFMYNNLWALDYARDGERATVIHNERLATGVAGRRESMTSLAVDGAGEIYMTSLGTNRIKTLSFRTTASTNLPTKLSGTGLFQDVATLQPSAALLGYAVNSPLWSDGASKRRWLALPSETTITFAEDGPWTFPDGTVFVKHFDMAMDERAPVLRRRLETRVLVAGSGGAYYGATYKWTADGTDAELLFESQVETLQITRADGSTRQQEYFYPSPADCLSCHNSSAGSVLGVRTAQLNHDDVFFEASNASANQLWTWSEIGMFDRKLEPGEVRALPSLGALDDETRSVEDRVRSYWDSNCSMCHGVVPGIRANWDARYHTPLALQGVILGPSVGTDGSFIVVPGDADASLLAIRDRSTDPNTRMPPVGRARVDVEYVGLLERWISSLASPPAAPSAASP